MIKDYLTSLGFKSGKDFSISENSSQMKVVLKNIKIQIQEVRNLALRQPGSVFVKYDPSMLAQEAEKYVELGKSILEQVKDLDFRHRRLVDPKIGLEVERISLRGYYFHYKNSMYYFEGIYTITEPLALIYSN